MLKPTSNKMLPPLPDCPLERCLKFLSGTWTPLIMWYLRLEPRRFGDLKRDLKKISAKTLTQRLKNLKELGVIERNILPTSPPSVEYKLTKLGKLFQPILDEMIEVGKGLK